MNIRFFIIALFICANFNAFSQERKNAVANRVTEAPVIDGILNDNAWVAAETNTDFYMLRQQEVLIQLQ
jgi:hypothetical protein